MGLFSSSESQAFGDASNVKSDQRSTSQGIGGSGDILQDSVQGGIGGNTVTQSGKLILNQDSRQFNDSRQFTQIEFEDNREFEYESNVNLEYDVDASRNLSAGAILTSGGSATEVNYLDNGAIEGALDFASAAQESVNASFSDVLDFGMFALSNNRSVSLEAFDSLDSISDTLAGSLRKVSASQSELVNMAGIGIAGLAVVGLAWAAIRATAGKRTK